MKIHRLALYRRVIRIKRQRFRKKLSTLGLPDYTVFSFFSIITGAVAGTAAVFFHKTVHFFNEIFFDEGTKLLFFVGGFAVILIPAIGMLIQSLLTALAPEIAPRRGVLEVIKAVAFRGGHIPLRTTAFHFIAPAVCIGSGGTVGPEGPIAQLGGGVASKVGGLFGLSDSRRRMFTAAGSGAAIAAVFNTPLGGIFFALEVILLNDFQSPTFSALILASVTASAISRFFLGNIATFSFEPASIGPYEHLYLYALLGIGAGLISLLYIHYSEALHSLFSKRLLPALPRWLLMTLVGLLVGACGYFYADIFGIGYNAINKILAESLSWKIIAILLIMKFLLVPLILQSGGFGGIFAPSLFMGACFGSLFAFVLNNFLGFQLDITTYILVSMGAVLGGINSIPISAILIIFEMTRDYTFILPLMLAVVSRTMIVQPLIQGSIYTRHLEQQGIRVSSGREINILRSIQVKNVMRDDVVLIPEHLPLPELIGQLIESPHNTFYTVNKEGQLSGTIAESDWRPIITEYQHLHRMLVAGDIAKPGMSVVSEDDNLDFVLKLFGHENVDEFPVVSAKNPDEISGSVRRQDVIAAYNRETLKYNLVDGLTHGLKAVSASRDVSLAKGYSVAERRVPAKFVGKTLAQLRLRNKYGLEVLMIRPGDSPFTEEEKSPDFIIPTPDYVIRAGDTLVIFGKDESIGQTKSWH
jgi:CIC family chloride channel protein